MRQSGPAETGLARIIQGVKESLDTLIHDEVEVAIRVVAFEIPASSKASSDLRIATGALGQSQPDL